MGKRWKKATSLAILDMVKEEKESDPVNIPLVSIGARGFCWSGEMRKEYVIEVPSKCETELTGVALKVHKEIRRNRYTIEFDNCARPLKISRNEMPFHSLTTPLLPIQNFAKRFLNITTDRYVKER